MKIKLKLLSNLFLMITVLFVAVSCNKTVDNDKKIKEIKNISVMDYNIVTGKYVDYDNNGIVSIKPGAPKRLKIYETKSILLNNGNMLLYQLDIKTEGLNGKVYPQISGVINGITKVSDSYSENITGTSDWKTITAPLLVLNSKSVNNLILNLIIEGKGNIWVKNIKILRGFIPVEY